MKFLSIIACLVSLEAHAMPVLKIDAARTIRILGPIDKSIIPKANKLVEMAAQSRAPIFLLVNSPGGSVSAGNVFISAMRLAQARGRKIKCLTTVMAASMAFSILANCNERYALPSSVLLFHPVTAWIRGGIGAYEANELAKNMARVNRDLLRFLRKETGMDKQLLRRAFYAEKWWTPSDLQLATKEGWLIVVTNVTGIGGLFDYRPTPRMRGQRYDIFNKRAG